jgi:hypothetical protein
MGNFFYFTKICQKKTIAQWVNHSPNLVTLKVAECSEEPVERPVQFFGCQTHAKISFGGK